MKCPYCEEEMKKGFLQSARLIYFTEKEHKFWMQPHDFDNEIVLSHSNFTHPTVEAYKCPKCDKIIIDCKQIDNDNY